MSWNAVLTVPMRNGNSHPPNQAATFDKFLPYLWGMETAILLTSTFSLWMVLTVPMRNGNREGTSLKFCLISLVLTVPMRNGNSLLRTQAANVRNVLTVPMRNGNHFIQQITSTQQNLVLTVPMRNGNNLHQQRGGNLHQCSYRTYEEWKPCAIFRISAATTCSYRTYEEWKHLMNPWNTSGLFWVLTVPMRNGNYSAFLPYSASTNPRSYRTYEEWKQYVVAAILPVIARFLPYLWGMETLLYFQGFSLDLCSYRTYEEWKLSSFILWPPYNLSSYRTYEEWKLARNTAWIQRFSSYRTYEEWKPRSLAWYCATSRNLFLPYLWGMETY